MTTEKCGSVAGHAQHMRDKTPMCEWCKRAHANQMRRWRGLRSLRVDVTVPAFGVVRRLRALAVSAFNADAISAETGLHPGHVRLLWRDQSRFVTATTHRTVAVAYERLEWRQGNAPITARRARKAGWASVLAWDEETIDDPAARPNLVGFDELTVQALMDGEPLKSATKADIREAIARLSKVWRLDRSEIALLIDLSHPGVPADWRREAA